MSIWGEIPQHEILDAREAPSIIAAMHLARECYKYFIAKKGGELTLFRIEGSTAQCVYAIARRRKIKAKQNKERYRTDINYRVSCILKEAKKRNTGDFDLTKEDILSRIQSGFCEATGMPFDLSVKGPFSPSLDQVVPSKGYTKDNIRVVCLIYNLMKSNFDERDVDRFIGQLRFNSDETWLP